MDTQKQHTMVVKRTFPDGSEEWVCPTCGRRMIMNWPPNYKRVIVEKGDEEAYHSGGTGGLSMGSVSVQPVEDAEDNVLLPNLGSLDEPGEPVDLDDPYLAPWIQWLDQNDMS